MHWHGIFVPNGMDGVAGLTQPAIPPGKTYRYEFTFDRAGTFMYHPHFDEMTQIALGMMGMIVVHPRTAGARAPPRHRDYVLMSHEMTVPIGAHRPDPLAMNDFNVLTFNGKAFPATAPLVAETGDLVRIRLGNLGPMDHHPIHIHGHAFQVVATDGGPVPPAARFPETTVLVPVGTTRTIEFVAARGRRLGVPLPHDPPRHEPDGPRRRRTSSAIDARASTPSVGRVVPGYMTMGQGGMGEMAHMTMPQPANSISMVGAAWPARRHRHGRHVHHPQGPRSPHRRRRSRLVRRAQGHHRRRGHRRRAPPRRHHAVARPRDATTNRPLPTKRRERSGSEPRGPVTRNQFEPESRWDQAQARAQAQTTSRTPLARQTASWRRPATIRYMAEQDHRAEDRRDETRAFVTRGTSPASGPGSRRGVHRRHRGAS